LDYSENYPSESTFWEFKEKLSNSELMDCIWQKHQQQLDSYGFRFSKDIIEITQDSKIITSDQGNYSALQGNEAKIRRSHQGIHVKREKNGFLGSKHIK
jgi:hypothetical protein